MSSLIFDNPLFRSYAFYAAILVGKTLAMAPLTSRHRLAKNIFANSEDTIYFGNKKGILKFDDIDIERVRRAHRNDLENIPVFLFISALFATTSPSSFIFNVLMMSFTLARIGHTFVYAVKVVPQPSRVATWGVGYLITWYMAARVASNYLF